MGRFMKSLSKILLAVWFLGAVDANAELKNLRIKYKGEPLSCCQEEHKKTIYTLEVKAGEFLKPVYEPTYYALETRGMKLSIYVTYPDLKEVYSSLDYVFGPAKIQFKAYHTGGEGSFNFVYNLQKTTATNSSPSPPSLPSNTVVIPTDASGPVEIVMESSKDLVNWTRAEPGTYGSDTPKRFFRIRAVVKP